MKTPGSHIVIVFNLTFNWQNTIQVIGGLILFIDFSFYLFIYPVAYSNISSLFTVLWINTISFIFLCDIFNIFLYKSKFLL